MIAEDFDIEVSKDLPKTDFELGKTIGLILQSIKEACVPFKKASSQPNLRLPLNENKLTQIFVEQLEVKIRNNNLTIGVKNQYSDLFYGIKGIPDFYFHVCEEGVTHEPLFVVESKRLPSQTYRMEYVIGAKKNGGIERFKIEKHGKGLNQCGLLGFIESSTPEYWLETINNWIIELSNSDRQWDSDEILKIDKSLSGCVYLTSSANRVSSEKLFLHHFWVVL